MQSTTLSIVIPAFNEADTIHLLLDKVRNVELPNVEKQIIVINDCSVDETEAKLLDYKQRYPNDGIEYFRHEQRLGKGAAVHTGLQSATGDYLLVQDADLEYDPNEYKILLQPILEGFADVVYGSRFVGNGTRRIHSYWEYLGSSLLTSLSNLFSNTNLSDMETCYKLFRMDTIRTLKLHEQGFGFDPEVTAKVSRIPNVRIYEMGISYYGRTNHEGRKKRWNDGLYSIFCIFKYNLFSK